MAQRSLEELTDQECLALLGSGRVGRLVYVDEQGPVAIPVNYVLAGNDVVMRVAKGTKQLALQQPRVAFEVDQIDDAAQSAWSIVVRGAAHEVAPEQVPALLRSMSGHAPAPWALGVHNVWIRIVASGMTGRRLGTHASRPLL